MSDEQQQLSNQISIQDLELSLEVYEIESDQKLLKLQELFKDKKSLDMRQVFYEERSSLEVKFQNIIGDLTEFLINQEVPSTEKLRRTFYRILESPLLLLFKVSRFEIFNLRLNAFDIQLQPIDAICELAKLLYKNIDEYVASQKNVKTQYLSSTYQSYEQFAEHAKINLIQDEIFILYSYLRKGAGILKKKIQDKIKIVEIFNKIQEKIILTLLKNQDLKTLKEMSILNYQIYLLQNGFDVLCFYLKVPFRNIYKDVFKELEILGAKANQTCNFDIFINIFVKFNQQILSKVSVQKIDDGYVDYLENIATTLLELWGCRICQFRQFFVFFKMLFEVHPDQKKLLQISLKHVPNLSKEDISLIRANYRQNVQNKNVELLSLLKKVSLDDINTQLSSIYHQILYNLNFETETKQRIIELFSLVNGNSSIQGFLFTVQKALKQWNHTIDLNSSVKFIDSEFALPKGISQQQIFQSLRLFTNLCILESRGFNKQFQQLVTRGTITKAMIGLLRLLLSSSQEITKLVQQNKICQQFLLWSFKFLQNTLVKSSNQWEDILLLLASSMQYFTTKENQEQLKTQILKFIQQNLENYRLGKCLRILKKTFQFDNDKTMVHHITQIFMKETEEKCQQTRYYRFFGKNVNQIANQLLSESETQFLEKYACIKGNTIQVKQPSCFKLSQLQVITNPIQFQKAMDNYYFTLDPTSKHFIQYIVQEWSTEKQSQAGFYTEMLNIVITKYHVSIPILCNIRIKPIENSKENIQFRFVEFLVNNLVGNQASSVKKLISLIVKTDTIKYRNGRDYVAEQIVPMVTKRILTLINSGNLSNSTLSVQLYQALSVCLQRFKLSDLKIDTIQKSLFKINYQIQISKCQKAIARLSQSFDQIIRVFFRKKQLDIKKKGLEEAYQKIMWNEIRTYNRSGNSQNQKPQTQQPMINDQIMVSPYTLSQQYNNDEYRIKRPQGTNKLLESKPQIKLVDLLPKLTVFESQVSSIKLLEANSLNAIKQIDLSKMKYDVQFHLGRQQMIQLESKQNWTIKQKYQQRQASNQSESLEKSITFVQYYLREMTHPQVSDQIALKSILSYLKGEISVSLIWSNPKNLQKIFIPLVIIYDFLSQNDKKVDLTQLSSEYENWKRILEYGNENKIASLNRILNLYSELGYHNLWGEHYQAFPTYSNILKFLQIKIIEEQSFLSIILKRSLQFSTLSQIKGQLNIWLDKIFSTRPSQQTSLMYKVGIDKNLLNLIMKSLQIQNLSNISFLFHSNFNNLRLYTDQLHQGLKALNMASKTRSYNEYIQLSKEIQDDEFLGPMKLFQQNFRFFIKIQREGYNFKKMQERKLCIQRLTNVLRQYSIQKKDQACKQCDKLIEQYTEQIQKLQLSIANRVKSFYLVTKLRDLSYQNAISINLTNQILRQKKLSSSDIIEKIKKFEIFSLLMILQKELVRFDRVWDDRYYYENYNKIDQSSILKDLNFCTTRRYSHSMSKIYQKCDLQLDEVTQRCIDQLKLFFSTPEGSIYLKQNQQHFYPGFLVKSFIQSQDTQRIQMISKIRQSLQTNSEQIQKQVLQIKKGQSLTECIIPTRNLNKKIFYQRNSLTVNHEGSKKSIEEFLQILVKNMIANETLVWTKAKENQFLTFNKYKSSQATLQQIQLLGYCIAYCIYHSIPLIKGQKQVIPLHSSIIAALSFNIIDIEDLLSIDFKIWQDVKRILSIEDSKSLNLNFSYIFENIKSLQSQRIQLVDKGASKKVNNLNRDQFCDAITCHVLFKNLNQQIQRFIQAILTILPKDFLSIQKISQIYTIFYNKQKTSQVTKKYMKKIGIVTPELVLREGKRVQNLRDYQNIEWASQSILESPKLRQKMWPNQSNIIILTTIGPKPSLRFVDQILIVQHFESKESLAGALKQLN